ncbi:MAG: hypothetical protein R3C61_16325 [Bacteroidia bacterium]
MMTFTGEDGSSFTGASAGFSGLVPPASLSGKTVSGLSGTWTATDANYFTIPSGTILFSPELACTFCQLIHFCGVITTILYGLHGRMQKEEIIIVCIPDATHMLVYSYQHCGLLKKHL